MPLANEISELLINRFRPVKRGQISSFGTSAEDTTRQNTKQKKEPLMIKYPVESLNIKV